MEGATNTQFRNKIVRYLDSLPASSAGKSEKVRKIQTLPAFAKAMDGQAIRNRKGIETAGKVGFEQGFWRIKSD